MQRCQNLDDTRSQVTTHLGTITVTPLNKYTFKDGLYGFKHTHVYALAPMPNMVEDLNYMVLHGLDGENATFIVKRAEVSELQANMSQPAKLEALLSAEGNRDALILGIMVIIDKEAPKGSRIRLHAQAPLIFNTQTMTARQVIID